MNYPDIIILIFGISYSFLIVHLIDNGMQINFQFWFLIIDVVALIIYGLFVKKSTAEYLSWGFLTLPIFIVALYNLLNLASWKINNREFRLKIRGSRNLYKGNTTWLDSLFSFLLVMSFFIWPILVALLLKRLM